MTDYSLPRLRLVKAQKETPVTIEEPESIWHHSVAAGLRHFVQCYITGSPPAVTAKEARDALRTALAAYQSSSEGRRIVL